MEPEISRTQDLKAPPRVARAPEEILAAIDSALGERPEKEACLEFSRELMTGKDSEVRRLYRLSDTVDLLINGSNVTPATYSLILQAGLQDYIDAVLSRNADTTPAGDDSSYDRPKIGLFQVARYGSLKFLPQFEELTRDADFEARRRGFAALRCMINSDHAETAKASLMLQHHLGEKEGEHLVESLERSRYGWFNELSHVAKIPTVRAVNALSAKWDEHYERFLASSSPEHEIEPFLLAYIQLAASNAPGAKEAIAVRDATIKKACENILSAQDQTDWQLRPSTVANFMLMQAALTGKSLTDLPSREKPEWFPKDYHWWFEGDYEAVQLFPDALACMAARGIPGAAEEAKKWQEERESVLCWYLSQPLKATPVETNRPQFSDYWFRKTLDFAALHGGKSALKILRQLQDEEWRAFDRIDFTSRHPGFAATLQVDGSRHIVNMVQERLRPEILRAWRKAALRLGAAKGVADL